MPLAMAYLVEREVIMSLNLWTDDRVGMLRSLWKEGHSARQIAMRIGSGISRNAVIGKAHRLGLSQRQVKALRRPVAVETGDELSSCQFPMGDPMGHDFKFCGGKVLDGKPYCRHHCGIAYVNLQDGEMLG